VQSKRTIEGLGKKWIAIAVRIYLGDNDRESNRVEFIVDPPVGSDPR
jgi:hypothetical protein